MTVELEATDGRRVIATIAGLKPVTIEPQTHQSLVLLPKLVAYLKKHGKSLDKIKIISLRLGNGSFTTTRQVVSLANTLHWLYGVTIVDAVTGKTSPQFMAPKYYSEPTITLPGKKAVRN